MPVPSRAPPAQCYEEGRLALPAVFLLGFSLPHVYHQCHLLFCYKRKYIYCRKSKNAEQGRKCPHYPTAEILVFYFFLMYISTYIVFAKMGSLCMRFVTVSHLTPS